MFRQILAASNVLKSGGMILFFQNGGVNFHHLGNYFLQGVC